MGNKFKARQKARGDFSKRKFGVKGRPPRRSFKDFGDSDDWQKGNRRHEGNW